MRVLVEEPLGESQEDSHGGEQWIYFRSWTSVAAVIMVVKAHEREEFFQSFHVACDLAQCQTEPIGKRFSSTFKVLSCWDISVVGEQGQAPSGASLEGRSCDNKSFIEGCRRHQVVGNHEHEEPGQEASQLVSKKAIPLHG